MNTNVGHWLHFELMNKKAPYNSILSVNSGMFIVNIM